MSVAFLLSGDEDLREGVLAAQEMGVQVVLLGLPPGPGIGQAENLVDEADGNHTLGREFWEPYFSLQPQEADPLLRRAEAARSGGGFVSTWAPAAGAHVRLVLHAYPVIPRDLDARLLAAAEAKLGPLEGREDLRHALRQGFWKALIAYALGSPP